mmetsp:Transcript_68342/g.162935  ORF Transcript_68342/g.162935 Transcript_68342/m.162935 type:complete len:131 (+) Transcript_68342:534-926(+)
MDIEVPTLSDGGLLGERSLEPLASWRSLVAPPALAGPLCDATSSSSNGLKARHAGGDEFTLSSFRARRTSASTTTCNSEARTLESVSRQLCTTFSATCCMCQHDTFGSSVCVSMPSSLLTGILPARPFCI